MAQRRPWADARRHLGAAADQRRACGRLHAVDHVAVVHALGSAARIYLCRAAQLLVGHARAEHADRLPQPRDLQLRLRRARDADRLRAGGAARPAHPRRERAAHDLSLSARGVVRRDRHGLELAAQSRPRHPEVRAQSRLGEFPLRLDHRPRHGALHHRHRGRMARRGLRDGAVPRRAALDRSRPAQGGADRRRRADALLSARRAAEHRRRS